jgi:acetoin utilization deacetylase AcuC-like enzyme
MRARPLVVVPPAAHAPKTNHPPTPPKHNNNNNSAHDPSYVAEVLKKSNDPTASVHRIGDESAFAPGGFEVAALSAGAALAATEAVLSGKVAGAYALSRPPGHHATRATGGGFCLFNNVAVAALHALDGAAGGRLLLSSVEEEEEQQDDNAGRSPAVAAASPVERIAIVDFDVHHGNGTQVRIRVQIVWPSFQRPRCAHPPLAATRRARPHAPPKPPPKPNKQTKQDIFYKDDRVLFISLHQDGNYPLEGGKMDEVGAGKGQGFNLNVPLPPGSGSGCYRGAFDRLVIPAIDAFRPDLVLVSAGYDAGYMDPLGQMMLGSHDYRYFMRRLRAAAARHSRGRLVAVHEGGYSDAYVPFCGLAAIEAICGAGTRSRVVDPYWADVSAFAYQQLQPWQDAVLREVEKGPLRLLKARCEEKQRQEAALMRQRAAAAIAGGGVSRGRGRPPNAAALPTVPGGGAGAGAALKASAPPAATSLPRRLSGSGGSGSGGAASGSSRTAAAREPEAACG